jgi:amino acid transporter
MDKKINRLLFGKPIDVENPNTFHNISLIALLAWVGLGADGLSSSSYGPDEAFRALGEHRYLAIAIAIATSLTVVTIASAYRGIINLFPYGGGGYIVATKLLGSGFGVVSGCALLVDYVLTIAVSIASGADQLFSVLSPSLHGFKLPIEAVFICVLVILNLRGVKESIIILAPIFALFLITHAVLIFGGVGSHLSVLPQVTTEISSGFKQGLGTIGMLGMLAVFLRAFSMGAGTYTGLEAVSNGLQIMREPKAATGKRTMLYMSISLAATAAGILICYLLFNVEPVQGMTMNAALLHKFAGTWQLGNFPIGSAFIVVTLFAEAALLYVGAQAGFIDGPRVMANMAYDGWLPRRFSQLSDRLTMRSGVKLMGAAALAVLFYTRGDITALVTMYSINVFLTFSLSMSGMCRHWFLERKKKQPWIKPFSVQATGLLVCVSILGTVVYEKFENGAWITIVITSLIVATSFLIRRHYRIVGAHLRKLDMVLKKLPDKKEPAYVQIDPKQSVAVMLVGGFSGLGVYQMIQVQKLFPEQFINYMFVSIAIVDSAAMKSADEVAEKKKRTIDSLSEYVALAQSLGYAADYRVGIGTEVVDESVQICKEIAKKYKHTVFFLGKLVFEEETWIHRLLHNDTTYRLERKLHLEGLNAFIITVNMLHGDWRWDHETLTLHQQKQSKTNKTKRLADKEPNLNSKDAQVSKKNKPEKHKKHKHH